MNENKLKLSIIILNYNSGKFLGECLESIKLANDWEIIVVDNNSTDNSQLTTYNKATIKLIENKTNLGFAKGNNIGVKEALKNNPEYILFLNPDTIVSKKAINTAVDFMDRDPKAGAVTVKLELVNGKLDETSHRGFPTPWRAFCHFSGLGKIFPKSKLFAGYTLGHLLKNKRPHEIDACTGAFMMVRTSSGNKLGWWDEDYYWYGEDLDFCYRIRNAGQKVFFIPSEKIIHYRGVTSGIKKHSQSLSKANLETKIRSVKASTEAMRIFYRKHYQNKYPRALTKLILFAVDFLEKQRLSSIQK